MTASDRRFVVPTWALGAKWRGLTKDERFRRVDSILADEGTRVVVLAAGATVHAWAAGIGTRLHYAYVPPELRGEGLGRRVITELLGGYPDVIKTTHPVPVRHPWDERTGLRFVCVGFEIRDGKSKRNAA